ncbi:MAG: proton-conducting transporter membrane subunit [Acidobacteriota bacterium]
MGETLLPQTLFLAMVGGYAATAAALVVPQSPRLSRWVGAAGSTIGASAGLALAAAVLVTGTPFVAQAPGILTPAGGLLLSLDRLGALFLAVLSGVAIPASVFGLGYTAGYGGRYSLGWMAFNTGGFLLAMSLVVCAANVITLVLAWELMALASYFLVVTEHDDPAVTRAGVWYAAMTHAGLLAILAAFFLLGAASGSTGWSFGELRSASPSLSPVVRNAVFLLALAGFGSKAGLVPLHIWLPRAHPAAPSHVSALMSGAMVKLGLYGILRVGLDLLGVGPLWWGTVVIGLGAASALVGVLYALVDDDLKRLLAYSTVENVGLVCLGIGAGMVFRSLGDLEASALAFTAALLHVINHAAFKGTLFLAVGSIVHATGTRDMNRLGGLARRMPWTTPVFLVGALGLAALPPLNGFVSEWLLFQSFLPGVASSRASIAVLLTLGVGTLALAGGLAAATCVKAFGISCLAIPRSSRAEAAHDAPGSMRAGMVALALACPALAVFTIPLLRTVTSVLGELMAVPGAWPPPNAGFTVQAPGVDARMSPVAILVVLVGVLAGVWLAVRLLASRRRRTGETWGCGRIVQTPRMQYTATAFAEPLRRVFDELYRPADDLIVDVHPDSRYFIQGIEYRSRLPRWFMRFLYGPVVQAVVWAATRTRTLQSGSVNLYLAYIVAVLVVLLGLTIGF